MSVDFRQIDSQCRLTATMILNGDTVQANKKINYLISTHPTLSGNIRLTITNYLLDMITNGQEASDDGAVRTPIDGDVHDS